MTRSAVCSFLDELQEVQQRRRRGGIDQQIQQDLAADEEEHNVRVTPCDGNGALLGAVHKGQRERHAYSSAHPRPSHENGFFRRGGPAQSRQSNGRIREEKRQSADDEGEDIHHYNVADILGRHVRGGPGPNNGTSEDENKGISDPLEGTPDRVQGLRLDKQRLSVAGERDGRGAAAQHAAHAHNVLCREETQIGATHSDGHLNNGVFFFQAVIRRPVKRAGHLVKQC